MNDKLKLSHPRIDTELDKTAIALEADENRTRYEQLRKNIHELERLVAEREKAANKSRAPTKANNKIGARKDGIFKSVSIAPSFNRTPVGPSMVPLPYPTTVDLSSSASVANTVRFNGKPAYILASSQASCKGDEKGSGGGVKSGTVSGEVKPTGASTTVRVEGKRVVREGDPCTMNGGNNPGIYVVVPPATSAPPGGALATSNPTVQLETPAERSKFKKWLQHTAETVKAAIASPGEGLIGAAKGLGNIPSNVVESLLNASVEQGAAEMEDAAVSQALFGNVDNALKMTAAAAETRKRGLPFEVLKFKMNSPAQEGGDTISTLVQLFAGGVGIVKGAARGIATSAAKATGSNIVRESATVVNDAKVATDVILAADDGIKINAPASKKFGVTFFGDDIISYYGPSKATIGNPNGAPTFFMPLEDSSQIRNAHDAAVSTGMAPSAQKAYLARGDIYGFTFPTEDLALSKPTAVDAAGWAHYLEGGNTAVRLEGENAGYMVNSVKEYITPGDAAVPKGSVLFKVGPEGEWIPLRRW